MTNRLSLIAAATICIFGSSRPLSAQSGSLGPIYYNGSNVGIGTATPAATLHIVAPVNTTGLLLENGVLFRQKNVAGTVRNLLTHYSDDNVYLDNQDGGVYIRTGSQTSTMFLAPSGNVGIGTTDPANTLTVNGTVQAKEVLVNTGWSDYVFAPGYRLLALKDTAAYIQENGHLPGIPSEAEVKEKGVPVGEMESKLLAKVEELTLHMIQADERNDRLERRNQELQDKLAGLESRLITGQAK